MLLISQKHDQYRDNKSLKRYAFDKTKLNRKITLKLFPYNKNRKIQLRMFVKFIFYIIQLIGDEYRYKQDYKIIQKSMLLLMPM